MSLIDARKKRDAARKELSQGIDPGVELEPPAPSANFEAVAREWHALNKPRWKPSHAASVMSHMEKDVLPVLGSKLIDTTDAPIVLAPLSRIEARARSTLPAACGS